MPSSNDFDKHDGLGLALVMLPMSGHTTNIEEPALFNQHVAEFLTSVDSGRWGAWTRGR
jgi:pimeloyl-ACP methyl ester carboxylesterase